MNPVTPCGSLRAHCRVAPTGARSGDPTNAVLDADVAVEAGEVLGVLGPNGAGKSTLLRALAGLTPLAAGRIELGDAVLADAAAGRCEPPERRPVGLVFQDLLLFPHLSALDNVAYGLRAAGVPRAAARATARGWLDRFELGHVAGRRPGQLSGGEAQRVAIARALAPAPRLLLLDEPFAALDVRARAAARALLAAHLREFAGPALLVTHDPVEALLLADRLLVLDGGRVVQFGRVAEVAARPRTAHVAALVGLNLWHGAACGGTVRLNTGGQLHIADADLLGPVHVAARPSALALHTDEPTGGSPRNRWPATVTGAEAVGDRVRLAVSGSPGALVDVTPQAVAELGLAPGRRVWVTVKATELDVYAE